VLAAAASLVEAAVFVALSTAASAVAPAASALSPADSVVAAAPSITEVVPLASVGGGGPPILVVPSLTVASPISPVEFGDP
jgi:hypothetical protein